ncbi:MAG TPA: hypothetical protein VHZ24_22370 [Pirellulales bacterium]|jgi:uncharacterized repeat protein (TIGR01451 family)|nr:hypothetical protein [Pirellulales bacterium]
MNRRTARHAMLALLVVAALPLSAWAQVAADDPFIARPGAPPSRYAPGSVRRRYPAGQQPAATVEPNQFQAPGNTAALVSAPEQMNPSAPAAPIAGREAGIGRPGAKELEGPQTPSVVLEKIAPAEVQVGKAATFELHVRNTGSVAAQQVTVTDQLPHGAQLVGTRPRADRGPSGELVWRIGTMKPGDEAVLHCDLMPLAEGELGSVATVHFAAAASARCVATRPQLAVDVTAPGEVLIGESATMQVKIWNPGSGVANGVVIVNRVPPNFEHPAGAEIEYEVGRLAPGESRTLELSMRAAKAGAAMNLLVARGDGSLQADRQTPVTVIAPALEVALQGSRKRFLDRQATYTVTVANPGTAAAQEVELVAYLPPGLEFVEANNQGQFDRTSRAVHWSLDELPAKEQGAVSLTVMPVESGAQPLRISGTAQRGLSVERPESIVVEGMAALNFQVTDLADPVEVGGETTYEIRVTNQGSKAAADVRVVAVLPAEMRITSAEGPAPYELLGSQVRFQELPTLAPKAETIFRIRAHCQAAGDMRARVQLTSAEIRTPITKEESTRVFADE